MVIDTSALAAILFNEAERPAFIELIDANPIRLISAVTQVESTIVVEARKGAMAADRLDRFLAAIGATVVPVSSDIAVGAIAAFRLFGKGRHPASLNLGDCFVYSLAKQLDDVLLFKGNDFAHTDLKSAAS